VAHIITTALPMAKQPLEKQSDLEWNLFKSQELVKKQYSSFVCLADHFK